MSKDSGLLIDDAELDRLHEALEPEAGEDMPDIDTPVVEVRTAFISDTHLGRYDSKTHPFSIFLDRIRLLHKIVIVGDGIDYWLFNGSRPHHLGRIFKDDTYLRLATKLLKFGVHVAFRAAKINVFAPSGEETMRWGQSNNVPLQKTLRILRKVPGIFIPGNHDELFRGFTSSLHRMGELTAAFLEKGGRVLLDPILKRAYLRSPSFGKLDILEEILYVSKNGERMHVCHGDRFDPPLKRSSTLGILATLAFHKGIAPAMRGVGMVNTATRLTDYTNSGHTLRDIEAYYDRYADFLDAENKKIYKYNLDHHETRRPSIRGGIHGHLHNPGIRNHRGYVFIDCGDWVDEKHCTAVVEHTDGKWQIMTASAERGIHPHPLTPKPIDIFNDVLAFPRSKLRRATPKVEGTAP
jgi:UDP-2,3-diacylglucosamine pyrophosphatase LpxH